MCGKRGSLVSLCGAVWGPLVPLGWDSGMLVSFLPRMDRDFLSPMPFCDSRKSLKSEVTVSMLLKAPERQGALLYPEVAGDKGSL